MHPEASTFLGYEKAKGCLCFRGSGHLEVSASRDLLGPVPQAPAPVWWKERGQGGGRPRSVQLGSL